MPPSHIQSTNTDNIFDTTCVVALTVTAGNFIWLSVSWNSNTDLISSVNGSVNGAYTRSVITASGTGQSISHYYKENIASGTDTVTVTFSAARQANAAMHEYSGVATASSLEKFDGAAGTGSSSTDADVSPSVTTTTDGQLIVGSIIETVGSTTFTAGTNYTGRQAGLQGAAVHHTTEDKVQASAGSVQATWTGSNANNYLAVISTFKAASAGTAIAPSAGSGVLTGAAGRLGTGLTPGTMIAGT